MSERVAGERGADGRGHGADVRGYGTDGKISRRAARRDSVERISRRAARRAKHPKFYQKWDKLTGQIREFRGRHIHLHKSFRRSYREDYLRPVETPGLLSHAMQTFKMIFKNWRLFLPFIAIMVASYILLVGLMNEEFYQKYQTAIDESSAEVGGKSLGNFARAGVLLVSTVMTGGLDVGMGDLAVFLMIFLFLTMWLVTIYLLRRLMAGSKIRLRDALYNALSPLISTIVVFTVIFVQCIPIMFVIISYSAALETGFLTTPFYALVYFLFAGSMLLLSGYLLSGSIMSLIAVTAPGLYPLRAIFAASDLAAGRRTRIVLRVLFLGVVLALIYLIVMMPIILLDLWFKSMGWLANWPIVPFFLLVTTCFVFIYTTAYLYIYYRWLLDYKEK